MTGDMPEGHGTPHRSVTETTGLALILVGGGLAAMLLIPVLGLTALAWEMASSEGTASGLFICHDQVCVREMTAWAIAGLGITALVVIVVVLAVWSSVPSLVAAALLSSAAFLMLLRFVLHVWERQPYAEVVIGAVVVATAPAALALGSLLRLRARRGA